MTIIKEMYMNIAVKNNFATGQIRKMISVVDNNALWVKHMMHNILVYCGITS